MLNSNKLAVPLLLMRISVFVVMLLWTLVKFLQPERAKIVYQNFFHIPGLDGTTFAFIGVLELLIILGFLVGYKKKLLYGSVLLLHSITTLASYKEYCAPFEGVNILFFAAWPMLAACYALYVLRDQDTMWVVGK